MICHAAAGAGKVEQATKWGGNACVNVRKDVYWPVAERRHTPVSGVRAWTARRSRSAQRSPPAHGRLLDLPASRPRPSHRLGLCSHPMQVVPRRSCKPALANTRVLICPLQEIEKAWKMVDHSHEKESRAKEIINSLKGEITNLSKLVEQGAGMSVGQEQQLNDLLAEKNQLAAERDAQVTRRKTPHRPPAASSDRAFIGLHPQRQACKPRMAPSLDAAEPASPHLTHPPTLCSSFPIPLPASSLPTPSGGAHLRATGANLGASRRNQRARIRARAHLEENFRDQNSARQRRR